MRLTLCLEGNGEGRVLTSIDMEEIVKMTITDDIEKSNFNPKMLKSATDLAYQCGYHQGRADAIDDFANWLVEQGILGNRCISDGEITDYGKVYAKKYKEQLKAGGKNEQRRIS